MDMRGISTRLMRRPEDIWFAEATEHVSYPENGHAVCFDIEDASFWYRHRNRCIVEAMKNFPPSGCLFDIGGGNGVVAASVKEAGFEVAVVEPGLQGALNAKHRGVETVVCSTLEAAHFEPNILPAVGLFDVIEHVEEDVEFLSEVFRAMKPHGRLFVTVPAHRWLWSNNDRHLGHFRRYSLARLRQTLESIGFDVEYGTYFFRLLPIPLLVIRTLPSLLGCGRNVNARTKRMEHDASGARWSRFLRQVLENEVSTIQRKRTIAMGASCLVVASKTR